MPSTTPGWTPQTYQGPQGPNAGDYRWNPQQGPQAANYRYTPGQTPDAAAYRYTPGAVPTLSGQELLANDPGVAFRMAEGRKALEASAAAKGGLLSGADARRACSVRGRSWAARSTGRRGNVPPSRPNSARAGRQQASEMGWAGRSREPLA